MDEFQMKILEVKIDRLTAIVQEQQSAAEKQSRYAGLSEWIPLEQAVALKGGCSLPSYKSKPYIRPCCGTNYKKIGGRQCWRKEDVLEWIEVSDKELKSYAEKFGVKLPANYEARSA